MRGGWNAVVLVVLVAMLGGIGYYYGAVNPIKDQMKLGLDLKGGVHMVLEAVESDLGPVTDTAVESAMKVIERRVNPDGVSEPVIQRDGKGRIIVQIADITDPAKAREAVGKTAVLKFIDPEGNTVLDGKDIEEAAAVVGPTGNTYAVTLKLKGEGPKRFADATTKWKGNIIKIMLDDQEISAPVVQSEITTGTAEITGSFTAEEAKNLADLINGGALPVKLELRENRVVTATLGADSLNKSAVAGVIGMGFVLLFMIVLYRIPGLMANIALAIYAVLTMAFLLAINNVFTLPGMAGLLLSIGMAVDANVIIFERIKEELRNGKGLRSGIDAGFHRAYAAVIDSSVTTLIAGVILWIWGTGPVKGFAVTLSVGVLLSMFTAITVSRWLITLCVNTGWFGKNLFGVKEVAR